MKLQFKVQQYQTDAVDAVVEAFAGQPTDAGPRNAEIMLAAHQLLENVQRVQRSRNLEPSKELRHSAAAPAAPNFDVEMETGTGKTYVYIKTIMELHKRYGWSKFIVVVPSVAIREGVQKSFEVTAGHFQQAYGTKPRSFIYNSSQLHELEQFSSGAGVQVMIINIQAFNATGKDQRRIYDTLDDFQSRRPIDVIKANRPIVIIDEPQKIGGGKSLKSLAEFNALMILRYSATHKDAHTKVHRLDALDAYNQKLVKKIAVRGITVKGLAGSDAYLYVEAIEIAKGPGPRARVEIEVRRKSGPIKRQARFLHRGASLYDISGGIQAYKDLFVTDIDASRDVIELSNGDVVAAGQLAARDVTEETKRRIQIREVIRAHLEKERGLFAQGIKVLSLFFIDEVAKYRDYSRADTLGEYARFFEAEYAAIVDEVLGELDTDPVSLAYQEYLRRHAASTVHQGYFSIDKKTRHQVDPAVARTGEDKGQSTDVEAYDLILKAKERLLSLEEPVRFIFSHSALREGWDNPNVFVMGMLKKSSNVISRRQEIGRGLRLAVNQHGERMDNPVTVHDINELTVVTDESYTDFVAGLQKEIAESLSARPRKVSIKFFAGKTIRTESGESVVEEKLARAIYAYLLKNDYIDDEDEITDKYKADKEAGTLSAPTAEVLKPVIDSIWPLVDSLYMEPPAIGNDRGRKKIPLNEENFAKREFQELWQRISHKAVYQVKFDTAELIGKCVHALDNHLNVAPMQYVIRTGRQRDSLDAGELARGAGFDAAKSSTHTGKASAGSQLKYDLLGEIAGQTQLTRRTIAAILGKVIPPTFSKFRLNPEQFIAEASRLINEQKAAVIVEHLELDVSSEAAVYAKLPRGFFIPTPVGNYNPDWAIAFTEGSVKHIYFVAETIEAAKIECAGKFFAALNAKHNQNVMFHAVASYTDLMRRVAE